MLYPFELRARNSLLSDYLIVTVLALISAAVPKFTAGWLRSFAAIDDPRETHHSPFAVSSAHGANGIGLIGGPGHVRLNVCRAPTSAIAYRDR